jgi:hypothetical protein
MYVVLKFVQHTLTSVLLKSVLLKLDESMEIQLAFFATFFGSRPRLFTVKALVSEVELSNSSFVESNVFGCYRWDVGAGQALPSGANRACGDQRAI